MEYHFIQENEFEKVLTGLIEARTVVGPVAKESRFAYEVLSAPSELRLDFDVTILPPKKIFFPTAQPLITFDKDGFKGCINPQPKILLGVHFYDIKGIDMTDHLFRERYEDWNYLANREATTIIGSNIQTISERGFWGTIRNSTNPIGHDGFLTKMDGGYLYECRTKKGQVLLDYGHFSPANTEQIWQAEKINEQAINECQEKLNHSSQEISEKVRASFNDAKLWNHLSEKCFSCGSCNIVCPTCYCFDVNDQWNIDQSSGSRTRYWDACLTEDFAKISLGEGATENFRDNRAERFRHRMMRKAVYLNEKLNGPACTGCGRCSMSCTADIADPVKIYETIMAR